MPAKKKYASEEEKRAAKNKALREAREKLKIENPEEYERRKQEHAAKAREKMKDPAYRALQVVRSKKSLEKKREKLGIVPGPPGRPKIYKTEEEHQDAIKKREEERKAADPNYKSAGKKSADNRRKKGKTIFTKDVTAVEGYEDAVKDGFNKKKWVCHHRLESYYRSSTLMEMKMYKDVPANQLIWLPTNQHRYDACSSVSRPLDSKWHKSIFEVIKSILDMADRSKLPKEFDDLVTEVENDEDFCLREEFFSREEISELCDIYQKMMKFASTFANYYTAMRLVETGKKKLW